MKKIILLCAEGMSTSMLVKKIREVAKNDGLDYEINAYPLRAASKEAVDADIILLGPQVRFELDSIRTKFPNIPSDSIDMRVYGRMDGKGVIEQIKKILGE